MADSFVHLHVHTEYSMLDGAARLADLFAGCREMGMSALAMTDHGNLYGAYDFAQQAGRAGIRPIIGTEAYIAPGSRFDRRLPGDGGASKTDKYSHMTLWAVDPQGYANLVELSSLASLEGYYYKPRMDRELLSRHAAGIVATTGCPGGEVSQLLVRGDYEGAKRTAGEYAEIFGRGNYYVELMSHGIDIEKQTFPGLIGIAEELSLPLVATNDLHYTRRQDAVAHEVLLCVQTGATLADPTRFRFEAQEFYLRSPVEMRELFGDLPAACDNTLAIAERVGDYADVFAYRDRMPRYPTPDGEDEKSFFRKEVWTGLARRFPDGFDDEHRVRAEYEMDLVIQMGFPSYFLVVADVVRWAKRNGIRVGPGRGSATGCLVAYALDITEFDPIVHGLLFERFLNPDRVTMPDIDLDIDERRRGDVIRYITERWGEDRVAQIITFGTIKAKQAIKDSARVLGYPYSLGESITKAMPPSVMGKDIPLSAIFNPEHKRHGEAIELRQLYESDAEVKRVIDTARGLEGLIRQAGVHAAGVILSSEPLIDTLPIWRRDADGAIITQFDYPTCEALGLLKIDFLGLRNLTVLDDCLRNIKANRGEEVVLEDVSLDDRATYELLARGDTLGVFQLDGGPMRALLRAMAPDSFEDIAAVLALYRPGPMAANAHVDYADRKNGRKPVVPIHPELAEPLAEILGATYNLIVYQEQVMAIAQKVAGYSLGQADLLRRAMGKKKKEILEKEFVPFSAGMRANGYGADAIQTLWDILVPFSDYGFNKSHTAGYGLVSYWTAYLKANHPAEYMAALLTSVRDDKDKSAVYLNECRRMGISVLPPDVNESAADFTPRGGDIRFGLSAVRNVGTNVVAAIVAARRRRGRYEDFMDFLRKVDAVVCNKRTVESLVKAGAFDSLGHTRRGLLEQHEVAVDAVVGIKRQEANGQLDLFGSVGPDADVASLGLDLAFSREEWRKSELLAFEREMLGLYVSSHPLDGAESLLAAKVDAGISALAQDGYDDGAVVTIGGIISGLQRKLTRQGKQWAIATIEDLEASVEALFFPAVFETCGPSLAEDVVVVVKGRLGKREATPRLVVMDLTVLDMEHADTGEPVVITVRATKITPPLVAELKGILAAHAGGTHVQLRLQGPARTLLLDLGQGIGVRPSTSLMGDLKALLGSSCVSRALVARGGGKG